MLCGLGYKLYIQFMVISTFLCSNFGKNQNYVPEQEKAKTGSSPPCKRRKDSTYALLADLFGETFSLPKRQDSAMSLHDQALDKIKKSHWLLLGIHSVGGGSSRLLSPYYLT